MAEIAGVHVAVGFTENCHGQRRVLVARYTGYALFLVIVALALQSLSTIYPSWGEFKNPNGKFHLSSFY